MNFLALIPGLILGTGIAMILSGLMPRHPQLAAAIARVNDTTVTEVTDQAHRCSTASAAGWNATCQSAPGSKCPPPTSGSSE